MIPTGPTKTEIFVRLHSPKPGTLASRCTSPQTANSIPARAITQAAEPCTQAQDMWSAPLPTSSQPLWSPHPSIPFIFIFLFFPLTNGTHPYGASDFRPEGLNTADTSFSAAGALLIQGVRDGSRTRSPRTLSNGAGKNATTPRSRPSSTRRTGGRSATEDRRVICWGGERGAPPPRGRSSFLFTGECQVDSTGGPIYREGDRRCFCKASLVNLSKGDRRRRTMAKGSGGGAGGGDGEGEGEAAPCRGRLGDRGWGVGRPASAPTLLWVLATGDACALRVGARLDGGRWSWWWGIKINIVRE